MQEDQTDFDFEKTVESVGRRQKWIRKTPTASQLANRVMAKYSVASSQASNKLEVAWKQAVGDATAQQTQPVAIRRGVLEVIVANSAIHQQLIFKKRKISKKLSKIYRKTSIAELKKNPQTRPNY